MVFKAALLFLITVPKGWIWYKDTTKDTVKTEVKYKLTPTMNDSLPYYTEDSLPIDPKTPEPIKRLILHPTTENAIKYITWMYRLQKRALMVSNAVEQAARILGIDYTNNLVGQRQETFLKQSYRDSLIRLAAREGMILAYIGQDGLSNAYIPLLEKISQKYRFFTLLITKTHFRINSILPVKIDQGEMQSIGIKSPPAIVYYKPDKNEVYIIARALVDEREILNRIQQVEVGLWQPILLHF